MGMPRDDRFRKTIRKRTIQSHVWLVCEVRYQLCRIVPARIFKIKKPNTTIDGFQRVVKSEVRGGNTALLLRQGPGGMLAVGDGSFNSRSKLFPKRGDLVVRKCYGIIIRFGLRIDFGEPVNSPLSDRQMILHAKTSLESERQAAPRFVEAIAIQFLMKANSVIDMACRDIFQRDARSWNEFHEDRLILSIHA